jgi:hypothetical protein
MSTQGLTCASKIAYSDRGLAFSAADSVIRRRRGNHRSSKDKEGKLHPYLCGVCSQWHLGHSHKEYGK